MPSSTPDIAMVFAAGLGTRMRPLTEVTPKPMIPIGGRPMLDHLLDRLAQAGVGTAIVNVHHLPEQIERHVAARTKPRIVISDERARLLDQGGGIAKVLPLIGDKPFLIANTDALWIEGPASNLARLAQAWDADRMDALLLIAASATSIGVDWSGDFLMDAEGRLTKRPEREVAPFVYTGVGIIKPHLFAQETREVFRLAPILFEAAEKGRLFGVRLEGQWLHVGTPEAIGEAELALARSAL
jgi:MurNAc alpha-1-phosphate uridylyltransferase